MRTCPAGVVRPLGSPAARSDTAAGPLAASLPPATAAVSNEPLLAASPGGDSSLAVNHAQGSDCATAVGISEEDALQSQQPASKRPRQTRKATKAVIDAGLQTLADAQVCRCA